MEQGDALSLEPSGAGWMVTTDAGRLAARDVVIALGPWSDELARRFGLRLPFFVKRGYHMHYEAKGNAGLTRPVLDLERGYLVTPMARGLRLTTGAEFARRDDPPSPAHLDRVEPFARELFPLGARQGRRALARPAPLPARHAPDHRAVPGPKGLWLDFGHHHLGLTLGPITGRLLADMMTAAAPSWTRRRSRRSGSARDTGPHLLRVRLSGDAVVSGPRWLWSKGAALLIFGFALNFFGLLGGALWLQPADDAVDAAGREVAAQSGKERILRGATNFHNTAEHLAGLVFLVPVPKMSPTPCARKWESFIAARSIAGATPFAPIWPRWR